MLERIKLLKLLTVAFGLIITMFTISFTVSNRQSVTVSLWPTPFEITLPLVFLIIIIGVVFFLAGWFFSWFKSIPNKINLKKENKKMKKKLETNKTQLEKLQEKNNENSSKINTTSLKNKHIFFN